MEPTSPALLAIAPALSLSNLHVTHGAPARILSLDQMGYVADMSGMEHGKPVPLSRVTGTLPHFIIPNYQAREHDPL